ncbi:MAG: tetratricopeptide repeat protein [Anaerolineae bacterium]
MMIDKLHQQGIQQFRDGAYEAAARTFSQALDMALAGDNPAKAAEISNDLGVVRRQLEDHDGAFEALNNALAHYTRTGDKKGQAQTLGNLAAVYEATEQFEEAVGAYKSAAALFEEVGESELAMYTWQALSRLRMRQGRWVEAIGAYEEGVDNMPDRSLKKGFLQRLLRLPGNFLGGPPDEDEP